MVDERDFFREATLRICGSLETETALFSCLNFIRQYIPADMMLLAMYNRDTGIAELIAKADLDGGHICSTKTVIPQSERDVLSRFLKGDGSDPMLATGEHLRDCPALRGLSLFGLHLNEPFLVMAPKPNWNLYGGGILITNHAGEQYTERHKRLFSPLNEPLAIVLSNYIRYREVLRLKDILADDNRYLQEELRQQTGNEIVGADFGLKRVMEMVSQVAPMTSPVLLLGETGTGKEVIATAIHNQSLRRSGPFIKVNCGAISESLMDSELFGHEKGAFTGALSRKRGRFERANGGTIFLDEIGELTPGAQVRLLRVLQEKEIERLGGTETLSVDIRVIAATHRNLETMIAEGHFREDLYFRLRVFPILIPPLRERRGDIPALVNYFLTKKSREMGLACVPSISPESITGLMQYDWPGNIRELQNVVERALILSGGKPVVFEDFRRQQNNALPAVVTPVCTEMGSLDQVLISHIKQALEKTGGRVGGDKGAAKLLQINPSTLRTKMRKLKIPFGRETADS